MNMISSKLSCLHGTPDVGFQLVLRLSGSPVLCPDAASRRGFARVVLAVGKDRGLIAFGAADTHGHILTIADRTVAGELAQAVEVALHRVLPSTARFLPVDITPVTDQPHLVHCFRYVQRNAAHHGVLDPLATEASSTHDLLGLRCISPWLGARVRSALPRTHRDELTALLGMPSLALTGEPTPATLAQAAAAVIGRAELKGEDRMAVDARVAAVALVKETWRFEMIARSLGTGVRTVQRYALRAPRPYLLACLRRHLAWVNAAAAVPDPLLTRRTG